jgi:hypothetical protein
VTGYVSLVKTKFLTNLILVLVLLLFSIALKPGVL